MTIREEYYINQYRQGVIDLNQAFFFCKCRAQSLTKFIDLLKFEAESQNKPRAYFLLVESLTNIGDNLMAKSVASLAWRLGHDRHMTHYINSDIKRTLALVDDKTKLLYVPMPKCGSSTIKNYFTLCTKGKTFGEWVHFNHHEMNRHILAEELNTKYKDYFKFTVVRDPHERVVSYFQKNVVGNALRRDAGGEKSAFGMETHPGPRFCADRFQEYRQVFIDFRHHTDPMSGYIGHLHDGLDRIYSMADLGEIKSIISDRYGVQLDEMQEMAGGKSPHDRGFVEKAFEGVMDFYEEDFSLMKRL